MTREEYPFENRQDVDLSKLAAERMPLQDYSRAHQGLIIPRHDILIRYNGAILLVVRDNFPAKGILWPIGGRIERGVPTEESLRRIVKRETGLTLSGHLIDFGSRRTYFQTDPFGHGHGTDTINERFFGRAEGELKLDDMHINPTLVRGKDYTQEFRTQLHPYVRDFMDLAMSFNR